MKGKEKEKKRRKVYSKTQTMCLQFSLSDLIDLNQEKFKRVQKHAKFPGNDVVFLV